MSNNVVFFVPYHTGYAHIELIDSFCSFGNVYLFVYKWNPAKEMIEKYFSSSNDVQVHEFSLETILLKVAEQEKAKRRIVILLTASRNYPFGQFQYRFFSSIQKDIPSIIDVYSTGHCMYGCQSCTHVYSHRLPITFTNYIRTKYLSSNEIIEKSEILICPSFSSEEAPFSLLSNKMIVHEIVSFTFPHMIKLHPLTYQTKNDENPLFSLSKLEYENVLHFLTSKNVVPANQTNTLKLIEQTRVLICDFDSSIPFEALYFQDGKHILVYETEEQSHQQDDRRTYFHIFRNAQQLTQLIESYFNGQLQCKTGNSHQFFLEKYEEPNGREIERLAIVRQWLDNRHQDIYQNIDTQKIKQQIKDQFKSPSTQTLLYALGEHTTQQIIQLTYGDINAEFNQLLQNIDEL